MDTIALLQNQLIIMEALLTMVENEQMQRVLRGQITFTEARIRALS